MKKMSFFSCVMIMFATSVWAADKPAQAKESAKPSEPTHEQRVKMAEAHEKMAACLKSDKPFSECRDEMRKSCKENMGKDECPMMKDGKGHGHGHHHDDDHEE